MGLTIAIIAGVLVVTVSAGFGIKTYNDLVAKRNKVKNSWAHIDAQLQRRFDLVPNLVETVKGFAIHEHKVLEGVTSSLSEYMNAHNNKEKIAANEQLTTLLKSLYNVTENYPQLRSDVHFLQMQSALAEIEEDITYARQFYNDAVTIYNNKLMSFPSNIIAAKFNFKEETLFDAVKGAEVAPKIQLRYATKKQCPHCGAIADDDSLNCKCCGFSLE